MQIQGSNFTSNSESNVGYGLRRKASAEQIHTISGNRIVDISKLVETINSLYSDYTYRKMKCKKIQIHQEIKHGLAWLWISIDSTVLSHRFPIQRDMQLSIPT